VCRGIARGWGRAEEIYEFAVTVPAPAYSPTFLKMRAQNNLAVKKAGERESVYLELTSPVFIP